MVSLRSRLILSHVFLVLFVILVVGIPLVFMLESQVILVNLSRQLSRQANLLAEIAGDYPAIWNDPAQAQAFVDRFQGRLSSQLTLLNADGEILASNDPADSRQLNNLLTDPDLTTALGGKETVQIEDYSQNQYQDMVNVLVPAFGPDGQVIGVVRLAHQLATVRERFEQLLSFILETLTVGLVGGTVVGLILAITIERSLQRLNLAIGQLRLDNGLDPLSEEGPPEIRVLINTLNALVERLRRLREAQQQLLANLAHELRQPLAALHSANYALLNGAADDLSLRNELLQGIDLELNTLHRLVDDLARFYDQAVNALELSLKPTPLDGWMVAVIGPWREIAERKGMEWKTEIPAGLPVLTIDPDRLGQALGNLFSNAIKYTPSGGVISVAAGCTSEAIWIQVSDTGIGIDLDELPLVFEPFFRGRAKTRFPQGMGLGLTIARDLILAHNGRLEIEAHPNLGSRFILWLPLTS